MNKRVVKALMKGYLTLRKLWDPLKEPLKVRDEYDRTSHEFQERINSFEYKADPLQGFLTIPLTLISSLMIQGNREGTAMTSRGSGLGGEFTTGMNPRNM